ncbi:MAG TPA: roadblock/LC7 domain-containing protein [Kineosporiaceae bacterium]
MSIEFQELSSGVRDVNWLLDNFVHHTTGVEQAVAVSSDGLLMAVSAHLLRSDADKLAAMISGLTSLAFSASRLLTKGALRQVITEFNNGFLLVSSISGGSCLGVITAADCDLGLVGYEATMLVQRIGALLTPELVIELKASLVL